MAVTTLPSPVQESQRRGLATRGLIWAAALLAALFGLGAIEYALALAAHRVPLLVQALGLLTSAEFALGPRATTQYMVTHYTTALGRVGPHMALGGVALGLGVLQFVPALRRRHPRWHRASGMVVWLATATSMAGAIGFLVYVPMRQGSSGASFHLGLWALALLTLALLSQAILAIRARDHRSHMVWMALVFACLATAPMLRIDWALWGRFSGLDQETANMATGTLVLLQTLALMAWWLARVGDKDLPARATAPASAWPAALMAMLCGASALVLLHEAVAALLGWDALAAWRPATDRLPAAGAALWVAGSLAVLGQWRGGWQRALAGHGLGMGLVAGGVVAAAGAVLIGLAHPTDTLNRTASAHFWVGLGALQLLLLAAAQFAKSISNGRNAWALWWLMLQWLPSQLPPFVALGWLLGLRFEEGMPQVWANGIGGIAAIGLATAFGARPHGWTSRRTAS